MKKKLGRTISALLILTLVLSAMGCTTPAEPVEASDFQDVSSEDWFYRYVVGGLRFGLVTYTRENGLYFEPYRDVTLEEFITMLGRLHEYSGETIRESYIEWASGAGLIGGEGLENLDPYGPITRERMAVIVDRYIWGFDLWELFNMATPNLMSPQDRREVSSWAVQAVSRMAIRRLVAADHSGGPWYYRPQANATRAEVLSVLVPMCRTINR